MGWRKVSQIMSSLGSESSTSTLQPSITRVVDTQLQLGPLSIVSAALIVFILSILTVGCNSIILAAFYRYKRLRTASNCLLVSLAVSDFGVGVFMPFGTYLELSDVPKAETGSRAVASSLSLCVLPYCILIALCSVSVLVTVAIAVDRLTSLAQPLRYKNIITHSSIEKYIAMFWIYATAVGLSPLIYARITDVSQVYSGSCRFNGVIMPPVRVFLFLAVWAPSAFILLGCYMYVYLVARAHARAIYTVELSFRNQTQTLVLPRYGQTLAVTVGAFFILWVPFQTCMLLDIFCGTNILSDCTIWLGLPILAHSGTNPWIYAFHHGEMRIAASKITEDLVTLFSVVPSRYGCSPTRRASHTNLELAEVNNSNEERRLPIENCFAAKRQSIVYSSKRCLEVSSKNADVSPESTNRVSSSKSYKQMNIVEEDIHDLSRMLDPKYIINRNHVINSNYNIDKIKNIKYLLDPTFSKIRHLRRLNHKRLAGKNIARIHQSRFVSYQNLKGDGILARKAAIHLNTMSDPALSIDSPVADARTFNELMGQQQPRLLKRKLSSLSSVSDSNIKDSIKCCDDLTLRLLSRNLKPAEGQRYSVCNIDNKYSDQGFVKSVVQNQRVERHARFFSWARARQRITAKYFDSLSPTLDLKFQQTSYTSLPTPDGVKSNPRTSPKQRTSMRHLTIIPNRLASLLYAEESRSLSLEPSVDSMERLNRARKNLEILKHSESINVFSGPVMHPKVLDTSAMSNSLTVPTIHSEPPSPIDPLPLDSLKEEDNSNSFVGELVHNQRLHNPLRPQSIQRNLKSPTRHSDPTIPSILLNIEDCNQQQQPNQQINCLNIPAERKKSESANQSKALNLLLSCSAEQTEENNRYVDPTFSEHKSTRFKPRQPANSKWSESSRSQEILSNITGPSQFPSSYSVNNFQIRNSINDLNDITCLDPLVYSDALSASFHESFFSVPSAPNSEDVFTSFEADELPSEAYVPNTKSSASSVNIIKNPVNLHHEVQLDMQSKSVESMFRDKNQSERLCSIIKLDPSTHRSRPKVRPITYKEARLTPLGTPISSNVCTPTFDITVVSDIKSDDSVGVIV